MASQNKSKGKPRGKPFPKGQTPPGAKTFPPGVSGNPGGRPKMLPEVKEMLLKATVDAARAQVDALTATKLTISGNGEQSFAEVVPDHATRLKASNDILDRMHGKAAQELQTDQKVTVSDDRQKSLEERLTAILARRNSEDTDE
jgi:hypothetical protein